MLLKVQSIVLLVMAVVLLILSMVSVNGELSKDMKAYNAAEKDAKPALEKALKEHGDKVSAEDKATIESSLTSLKDALKDNDVKAIKSKTGSLTEASMKLGEAIYKAQQPEQKPDETQPQENADGKKDEVVDADFEEVKDEKVEK